MIGQEVETALKAALKAKDELSLSCLRMVRAAFKNKAKELRRELEKEEEIQCLSTMAKQRKDSIEQFRQGGREDLAQREAKELEIIQKYLPAQMTEDEVAKIVEQVFTELSPQGPKDMGKVMKKVMAEVKGRADGKLVNQLVRKRLGG